MRESIVIVPLGLCGAGASVGDVSLVGVSAARAAMLPRMALAAGVSGAGETSDVLLSDSSGVNATSSVSPV